MFADDMLLSTRLRPTASSLLGLSPSDLKTVRNSATSRRVIIAVIVFLKEGLHDGIDLVDCRLLNNIRARQSDSSTSEVRLEGS